ncbi:MAG: D-arabinono-1,4-lactone oxidase [Caldilineaceae bacterium]
MMEQTTQPTRPTWTNWVGNQSFSPKAIYEVSEEAEVAALIQRVAAEGISVRTFGTGHSFTPIVETDGLLLDTSRMRGVLAIDKLRKQVTALPKTTVGDFGEPLWEHGLALANQGDIDTQAIAGAVATGTHGSGNRLPSFSAALVGARFVDGLGNVVNVSTSENAEVLPALQTSLGLLGLMTQLTLQVTDAYELHARNEIMPFAAVMERFDEYTNHYRSFSFFWMPSDASAALYCLDNGKRDDCAIRFFQQATPAMSRQHLPANERIDRSYRIYPMHYDPNFHEMEYFLPLKDAHDILREMRKLMFRWLPLSVYPLEIRTVAGDQAWMSPNYQSDNLVVSISGKPSDDYWPYLRACDALFAEFKGRPHWGKLHFMSADRLARLFPRYEEFMQMRRRFDPKGIYLNKHTRALFDS